MTETLFSCNHITMEDKDLNIIKVMASKLDNLERMVFELTALTNTVHQTVKQSMFLLSKGAEPFNQVPRGEKDTVECEGCTARIFKQDSLKKAKAIGNDVILQTLCKRCFYKKHETV